MCNIRLYLLEQPTPVDFVSQKPGEWKLETSPPTAWLLIGNIRLYLVESARRQISFCKTQSESRERSAKGAPLGNWGNGSREMEWGQCEPPIAGPPHVQDSTEFAGHLATAGAI